MAVRRQVLAEFHACLIVLFSLAARRLQFLQLLCPFGFVLRLDHADQAFPDWADPTEAQDIALLAFQAVGTKVPALDQRRHTHRDDDARGFSLEGFFHALPGAGLRLAYCHRRCPGFPGLLAAQDGKSSSATSIRRTSWPPACAPLLQASASEWPKWPPPASGWPWMIAIRLDVIEVILSCRRAAGLLRTRYASFRPNRLTCINRQFAVL